MNDATRDPLQFDKSAPDATAQRFLRLIQTFPTLRVRGIVGIGALREIAIDETCAHGAKHAARFCLSVYDFGRFEFNCGAAWGGWDNAHRDAWKAWAADPWFA